MVANAACKEAVAPPSSPRPRTPLEATRSLTDPHEGNYVQYTVTADISEYRAIALVYANNLRRCAPYWFPLALHPLMASCPKCRRHTPLPYFEGAWCADCVSNRTHDLAQEWRWFEENHRYLGWWQRGLAWYATRPRLFPNVWRFEDEYTEDDCELSATAQAQEYMRFYGKPTTEVNLAEDLSSLHAEIQHYNETGTLAKPVKVTTVEAQYTHNAGAN